ncbi:MAG: chemotaxis protein CheB [Candidatus Micrarchaeota archaeon]
MADVLIVDDSRFMRMMLRKILTYDPDIHVIGEAKDGISALEFINQKTPQIVTLDLQMPGMDGLTVLTRIMKEKPTTRVVVISAPTKEGAEAGAEALKRGAVGMVAKPSGTTTADMERMKAELIRAVKDAVSAKVADAGGGDAAKAVNPNEDSEPAKIVVVICASTGGPQEIRRVVGMLNEKMPAAVIVMQQLHSKFTRILMKDLPSSLNETTEITVGIANDGDALCNGHVTFAPEENDIILKKEGGHFVVHKQPLTGQGGASFDVLMTSVAEVCGKSSVGAVLTGDGEDGIAGLKAIKAAGGKTIVQDPNYGCASPQLPKNVLKSFEPDFVLKLEEVAPKVLALIGKGW